MKNSKRFIKNLVILAFLCSIMLAGCSIAETKSNESSTSESTSPKKAAASAMKSWNKFFFKSGISQINYKGSFLFDDVVDNDVKLNINEVVSLKSGKLYELKLGPAAGVPDNRLSLGYFYVLKDKIYKIEPTEENLNKLKTSEELPSNSVIICQDTEMKDPLREDEPGWHHYIEVNGNKREYHSYNDEAGTGYYESFTWEKNKGLIYYKSGFGAERESIEIQLQ